MHFRQFAILTFLACSAPAQAFAFDYLEHAFFSDFGCSEAVAQLKTSIDNDDSAARFLAISMFCPKLNNKTPYCIDGYKQVSSSVNPVEHNEFGVTFGDFAALPDHLSRFGPIKNLDRAKVGLVRDVTEWMVEDGPIGGVIEDVGEDACEYESDLDWTHLFAELRGDITAFTTTGMPEIDPVHLEDVARDIPQRGPVDPPMKYSFDNPHYLDLVLRNHTHFGQKSFGAWQGFRDAARSIASKPCVDVIALSPSDIETIAEGLDRDDIDWDDLSEKQLARAGCDLLGEAAARRFSADRSTPELAGFSDRILKGDKVARDQLVSAIFATVFVGTGLHYLQDGLAGGHMRTIRSRESLAAVRHDHDEDNRYGVVAVFVSKKGHVPFVAYGDAYLLGSVTPHANCANLFNSAAQPTRFVTDCLIRYQRTLLAGATQAEVVSFIGGFATDTTDTFLPFVMPHLPGHPSIVTGESEGTLPVPPPRFSYASLLLSFGFAAIESSPQIGLKVANSAELDAPAHWLTSYQLGINYQTSLGDGDALFGEAAFAFHYRFYARASLDFIPEVFAGVRGLGTDATPFFGFSPGLGFTVLPEGWIDLPLEASLSYRLPLTFFNNGKFFDDVYSDHWIRLGIGLAYTH